MSLLHRAKTETLMLCVKPIFQHSTLCSVKKKAAQRGIKNVGQRLSWYRPDTDYHNPLMPFFISSKLITLSKGIILNPNRLYARVAGGALTPIRWGGRTLFLSKGALGNNNEERMASCQRLSYRLLLILWWPYSFKTWRPLKPMNRAQRNCY